jgi:DNA-binding XRE family transcriptional regulator
MAAPFISAPPEPTVSKAVVRAAALLGLNQTDLAEILGISKATASRLAGGTYTIEMRHKKEWELALLFIRLFRSLDAILGHGDAAKTWLQGPHSAFGRSPKEEIRTAEGLVRIVQYLDANRGRV